MIAWDYHIILRICGFPFEEIGIVLVDIRAILDPRTRPLGLDDRNRSGTYLFLVICTDLASFYAWLISFSSLLISFYGPICRWHQQLSFPSMVWATTVLLRCSTMSSRSLVSPPSKSSTSVMASLDPTDYRATSSSTSGFLQVRPC